MLGISVMSGPGTRFPSRSISTALDVTWTKTDCCAHDSEAHAVTTVLMHSGHCSAPMTMLPPVLTSPVAPVAVAPVAVVAPVGAPPSSSPPHAAATKATTASRAMSFRPDLFITIPPLQRTAATLPVPPAPRNRTAGRLHHLL